jgi:hypothetical protein
VVIGAALLTLFLDLGWATGYTTIVIAHVAFEISFIAMTVRARMRGFDWTLEDASMDLGAGPARTFFKVTLPLIVPGIIAAAMLSFALSLDDFIITYFVRSTVTYPLYVNAAVKAAVPPQINVLATAILVISLLPLAVGTLYRRKRIDVCRAVAGSEKGVLRASSIVDDLRARLLIEADGNRYSSLRVTVGDRVSRAVGTVEIEQSDGSAFAEEVAPPVLCIRCGDIDGQRFAGSSISHGDLEGPPGAAADITDHHQPTPDDATDNRR